METRAKITLFSGNLKKQVKFIKIKTYKNYHKINIVSNDIYNNLIHKNFIFLRMFHKIQKKIPKYNQDKNHIINSLYFVIAHKITSNFCLL